ncbi:hypothetical protein L1987_11339 [Smallanthus sonchifolius]|uniref:Uncharacterized protein n=1 Tax=Smallanthus sonchifolius TaxID=185202 RepID=A0ACB9JB63_9ASTR|nr:hypothetical protein L1987_11339 [Smallanthus sonchifolius]
MVLLNMLRPLVESKAWDYCIVWKFGDDPSRCIEWMGCCCSGSQGVCENVKEENYEIELHVPYLCRDTCIKHLIRTSACEKLAMVPSSLSLFHGIHGEVAVSKQPIWLSNDSIGTQIVVPVEGGLIELFRSKHVPEDQRMLETIITRLGIIGDHGLHDDDSESCLSSYLCHHVGPKYQLLFPVQPVTHPNTQGLSSGDGKDLMTTKLKKVKESRCQSKNLVAERNRRKRIKDGLYTLRALVPKISKMDRASIVGDAIDYIIDLQKNVKELQDELKLVEEQDCDVNDDEVEVEVEVHEISTQEFLLKLMCSHKPGRFLKIMETFDSLGLEAKEDVVAKSLRDSLLTVCSIKTI